MSEFIVKSGEPDVTAAACRDCRYMQMSVNIWCKNDAAVKAHGTNIPSPGRVGCSFYRPMRKLADLSFLERLRILADPLTAPFILVDLEEVAKKLADQLSPADRIRKRFVGLGAAGRLPKHVWLEMLGIRLCSFCAQDEVTTGTHSVCPAQVMILAEAGDLANTPTESS